MNSAIYSGRLRHRRFHPKSHEFTYDSTLFYIDLDELPTLFKGIKFWSIDKFTLGKFRRADYLGDPAQPLIDSVRAEVVAQRGTCPSGAVRMLANLRMWGVCFNPVTIFYIFEPAAQYPSLILAQVTNTPWDERHCYIISCDEDQTKTDFSFSKTFHVSPFNPLEMTYRWVSTNPDTKLLVHMENRNGEVLHMDATLTLQRQAWTNKSLQKILWLQPWLTLKVPVAIYWQALKLWFKRVPIYDHSTSENSLDNSTISATKNKKVKEK